ncbi:Trk-type K+ transport system membrane component [Acholeplasma morum]|uniref:TrkH family potassium uptake protein n=1 Tax=Paracholeplasma morum TaxID=264637 RepID=UPI00195DFA80|nr:potassium transporter TrkG [Paracholeplasma morum]MBM7453521.1 Trk-type K+ transport system membrane component [Paracholeplasma morum]
MKLLKRIKKILFVTPARTILTIYLLFTLVGSFLLWLPISLKPGVKLDFIDAVFIAVSQISSTGLSPVSQADTFSLIGGVISIIIIQVGGLGIILLVASYWVIIGKKIGIKERNIIAAEQNQFSVKGIIKLITNAVIAIFAFQAIYIVSMTLYIYIAQPFSASFGESLFHALYLAASSFANAGFDFLPTNNSFVVFRGQVFPQVMTMIIVFVGGVGFWPLAEFTLWIKAKIRKTKHKISFITKLLVTSHFLFWIISALVYFVMEYENSMKGQSLTNIFLDVFFMSNSARSAGFYNTDITKWTEATRLFYSMLMFIGAAPNSSGGGIRMTTFFLLASGLISFGRHRKQVFFAGKAIKDVAVRKSYMVFALGIILVMFSTLLVSIIEPNRWSIMEVGFEISSAFGTAGLSLGLIPYLSVWSKLIFIVNMFIGRIGILTAVAILENKKETTNVVTYAEIDMLVG